VRLAGWETDGLPVVGGSPQGRVLIECQSVEVDDDPMQLTQMSVPASPALVQVTLIFGGSQQAGYVYIGTNQGLALWGHADIVSTLVVDPEGLG
jgi:hypothetical protein